MKYFLSLLYIALSLAAHAQLPRLLASTSYRSNGRLLPHDSTTYSYDTIQRHGHWLTTEKQTEYRFRGDSAYIENKGVTYNDVHGHIQKREDYELDTTAGTFRYSCYTFHRCGRWVRTKSISPDTNRYITIASWRKKNKYDDEIRSQSTTYRHGTYYHNTSWTDYDHHHNKTSRHSITSPHDRTSSSYADSLYYNVNNQLTALCDYHIDSDYYRPWDKHRYTYSTDGDLITDTSYLDYQFTVTRHTYDTHHRLIVDTTFSILHDDYSGAWLQPQSYTTHAYYGWLDTACVKTIWKYEKDQMPEHRILTKYDQHGMLTARIDQHWDTAGSGGWVSDQATLNHYSAMAYVSVGRATQDIYAQYIEFDHVNIRAKLPATGRIEVYLIAINGDIDSHWVESVHSREYLRTIETDIMDDEYILIKTSQGNIYGWAGVSPDEP